VDRHDNSIEDIGWDEGRPTSCSHPISALLELGPVIARSSPVNAEESTNYRLGGCWLAALAECNACVCTLFAKGCTLSERFIFIGDLSEYRMKMGGDRIELARRKHLLRLELLNGSSLRAMRISANISGSNCVVLLNGGAWKAFMSRSVMWRFGLPGPRLASLGQ
jgi:hypothetical protein